MEHLELLQALPQQDVRQRHHTQPKTERATPPPPREQIRSRIRIDDDHVTTYCELKPLQQNICFGVVGNLCVSVSDCAVVVGVYLFHECVCVCVCLFVSV